MRCILLVFITTEKPSKIFICECFFQRKPRQSSNILIHNTPPTPQAIVYWVNGILVTLVWKNKGIIRFCCVLTAKQTIGGICLFSLVMALMGEHWSILQFREIVNNPIARREGESIIYLFLKHPKKRKYSPSHSSPSHLYLLPYSFSKHTIKLTNKLKTDRLWSL